jgi:tetratricopeptide (TPR) repeat protein
MTMAGIGGLDAACAEGLSHHQAGRIDEARRFYRKVLHRDPKHLNALHLLSTIYVQTRQAAEALPLLARAIRIAPNNAQLLCLQGAALEALGRNAEALVSYDAAIALQPGLALAHYNRAVALSALGRAPEALASYDAAIALQPGVPQAHYNRGVILQQAGRAEEALASFDRAIALDPRPVELRLSRGSVLLALDRAHDALREFDGLMAAGARTSAVHNGRGLALLALGRADDAVAAFDAAIQLEGGQSPFHVNRGLALQRLKRLEEASASFDTAVALAPDDATAHNGRGAVLQERGLAQEALEAFDRAIELQPKFAEPHRNRGVTLLEADRLAEAEASFRAATTFRPSYVEAHNNLGSLLYELNLPQEALANFDRAIASKPDDAAGNFNKSLALLSLGRFEEGWKLYEWRDRLTAVNRRFEQPPWLGEEALAGKTILLHGEQGLGDTLQFCRYARHVAALGADVILEAPPAVVELMQGVEGVRKVVSAGDDPGRFDRHCPLMSLPLALMTMGVASFGEVPYLHADPDQTSIWKQKLGDPAAFRVGLVWNGGFRADDKETWRVNQRRNVPFETMANLNVAGVDFFSLQKGEPAETQLAQDKERFWPSDNFHNLMDQVRDFSDTAALVANLDLVIAVDTSTAHLAGGMGKPVWILNRFDNCWRWGFQREDTPWYPSARLFRQPSRGDWASVIDQVRLELERQAKSRKS